LTKLALFDLDGTLIDSEAGIVGSATYVWPGSVRQSRRARSCAPGSGRRCA
jgi:hypothetical protein